MVGQTDRTIGHLHSHLPRKSCSQAYLVADSRWNCSPIGLANALEIIKYPGNGNFPRAIVLMKIEGGSLFFKN